MGKKIKKKLKNIVTGLALGMESANQEMFTQNHAVSGGNVLQIKEAQGRLSEALQKGELTQEVKDLRYRMFKVLDATEDINMIVNRFGDVVINERKKPKVFEQEGDILILVQNTNTISDDSNVATDYLYGIGKESDDKQSKYVHNVNVNKRIENIDSPTFGDFETILDIKYKDFSNNILQKPFLKIVRNNIPRFKIEDFSNKIVLSRTSDEYFLDIYVTKYKDNINRIQRLFTREVERIFETPNRKSDVINFVNISFVTSNPSFGCHSLMLFDLNIDSFVSIAEFNGDYVLRFKVEPVVFGKSLLEDFISDGLEEKYKQKEHREQALTIGNFDTETKLYCEECGKEMIGLEKSDWSITKADFGKGLCIKCFEKALNITTMEDSFECSNNN